MFDVIVLYAIAWPAVSLEIGPQFPEHGTGNRAPISGKTTIYNVKIFIYNYYVNIFVAVMLDLYVMMSCKARTNTCVCT